MAKRGRGSGRADKPNPYRGMGDAELAREWARMLDARADRLAYFAALPDWQATENIKIIKDDPEAWGLTRGEFDEWCRSILEHWAAAWEMCDAGKERHRRLYEAERRRVGALPYPEAEKACEEARREPYGPTPWWKLECETMQEYVARVEADEDRSWAARGARAGLWDSLDEWIGGRLLT